MTGSFLWRLDTDEITFSEQLYRIFEFDRDVAVTLGRMGGRVHPEIDWAKLRTLAEGAALATRQLW